MGKGELLPELMLIFESENTLTYNSKKIVNLRRFIQNEFNIKDIYHSFLVRCHPKACSFRRIVESYNDSRSSSERYIDNHNICLWKQEPCNGIFIKPDNEEIIMCLPFLLEEITILRPRFVILFGMRTAEFVLKSFGFFTDIKTNQTYEKNAVTFIYVNKEFQEHFIISDRDIEALKGILS